ncbi:hypothetical protein ACQY0O_000239 [Thecaphora frezii]
MPRRKIGADLKEALCKLYEAGDISADTIEKHGIMSRATFFRNLKMWKAGDSLEQRHSTGRKTNADKRREQEQQEVDRLQPVSLQQLHLSLLEDIGAGSSPPLPSDKGAGKAKEEGEPCQEFDASRSRSVSVDDDAADDEPVLLAVPDADAERRDEERRSRQNEQARNFCLRMIKQAYGFDYTPAWHDDLDSLLDPDGNQYSTRHRGAFWVVRQSDESGPIVATVGLRSFIWKPQLYQSLGVRYASKSIDKVGYLGRLYVDPIWRRRGIGRWLTSVAELKASKLGFSTIHLHATSSAEGTIAFWRSMGYTEFGEIDGNTHFDRGIVPNVPPPLKERRKRLNSSAAASFSSSANRAKRPRQGSGSLRSQNQSSPSCRTAANATRQEADSAASLQSPLPTGPHAQRTPLCGPTELPAASPGRRGNDLASPARPPEEPAHDEMKVAIQAASGMLPLTSVSSRATVSLPPPPRKITFHEAVPQSSPSFMIRTGMPQDSFAVAATPLKQEAESQPKR